MERLHCIAAKVEEMEQRIKELQEERLLAISQLEEERGYQMTKDTKKEKYANRTVIDKVSCIKR